MSDPRLIVLTAPIRARPGAGSGLARGAGVPGVGEGGTHLIGERDRDAELFPRRPDHPGRGGEQELTIGDTTATDHQRDHRVGGQTLPGHRRSSVHGG